MKWTVNDQDKEDYEQEIKIREWLKQAGMSKQYEFQHINSNGNPRNTLVRAAISLDQQISENGGGTFSDLIAGCDGRDLEYGINSCEVEDPDPIEVIDQHLLGLGFKKGELQCLKKILRLSVKQSEAL